MHRIAVLTDSSAYLPPDILKRYDIHVIPFKLYWDGEILVDGIDLTPAEFYTRLATSPTLPTTSQLSRHDFLQAFNALAPRYEGILMPLISSGVSGTVASAIAAAADFDGIPVEVVDSRSTSAGLALVVQAAARAVAQGHSLSEAAQITREIARKTRLFFAVETLSYLHKGGRIGGAARYLGTALDIKPILFFNAEGKIDALERVRTKKKAFNRLLALAEEEAGGRAAHIGVLHANAAEEAQALFHGLTERLNCKECYTFELCPAIGVHVGPGTVGLALYAE